MHRLLVSFGTLATPVALAGERDTVETFNLDGQPVVQVMQPFRAQTSIVQDRGNRVRTLAITIKGEPQRTPPLALRWALEREQALGTASAAALRIDYGSPGVGLRIEAASASLALRAAHAGVTPLLSLTITLGAYSLSDIPLADSD